MSRRRSYKQFTRQITEGGALCCSAQDEGQASCTPLSASRHSLGVSDMVVSVFLRL